ncbi:MAG: hypothetical protein MK111_22260 [Crocosphaera sp.]|nr:hypothetical protein [Crocosphaera sp.]MCH2247319.1 hypothetical protein [Crocosphaera sp.]
MITVVIMGILAALTIPSLLVQVARSRETEAVTTLVQLGESNPPDFYRNFRD